MRMVSSGGHAAHAEILRIIQVSQSGSQIGLLFSVMSPQAWLNPDRTVRPESKDQHLGQLGELRSRRLMFYARPQPLASWAVVTRKSRTETGECQMYRLRQSRNAW